MAINGAPPKPALSCFYGHNILQPPRAYRNCIQTYLYLLACPKCVIQKHKRFMASNTNTGMVMYFASNQTAGTKDTNLAIPVLASMLNRYTGHQMICLSL